MKTGGRCALPYLLPQISGPETLGFSPPPKVKLTNKGKPFKSIQEVGEATTGHPKTLTKEAFAELLGAAGLVSLK